MDILLFGIQGSGKGAQARALSLALNIPIYEAGAELRKLAVHNSVEGKVIREVINKGALVPPGIVLVKIAEFLEHPATTQGVIFDGVPRSYDQAIAFEEMENERHRETISILIELDEQQSIKRLSSRRICTRCQKTYAPDYKLEVCNVCGGILIKREDDQPVAVKKRIENFYRETKPVIEYYKKLGRLLTVNGDQAVIDVTKDIFNQLSPLLKENQRKLAEVNLHHPK